MAHSGTTEVALVLRVGSNTELMAGSQYINAAITDADALIDSRLLEYGLSVSGTSSTLVNAASKYISACYYARNYKITNSKEDPTRIRANEWMKTGSAFLWQYIMENSAGQTNDPTYGPATYFLSTNYENPDGYGE